MISCSFSFLYIKRHENISVVCICAHINYEMCESSTEPLTMSRTN